MNGYNPPARRHRGPGGGLRYYSTSGGRLQVTLPPKKPPRKPRRAMHPAGSMGPPGSAPSLRGFSAGGVPEKSLLTNLSRDDKITITKGNDGKKTRPVPLREPVVGANRRGEACGYWARSRLPEAKRRAGRLAPLPAKALLEAVECPPVTADGNRVVPRCYTPLTRFGSGAFLRSGPSQ